MAEIRSRISLEDAMSGRLGQISNSLNIMIGHMETANATTRQLESSLSRAVSSSIASSFSNMSTSVVESINRISTSLATALDEPFRNLTNEMQRVAQNIETMSTNIETALTRISSGASRATENVGIFGRMFKGAFGQYFLAELMSEAVWRVAEALFQVPSAVINLADEFASTQARIGLITDDVQGLSDAIYQASLRSRGSYAQMADTVAKLGLTARNAFKSTEEIVPFVENIQKMFAIGGTGTAQQQASLLQLSQALGSGKLQGDEFRSIAENAPMLEQIISKYMGVTQGELKDLAKDGEITASIMRNAILGATDEIEAKFKNMPRTFGQNMQLLGTIAFNAFTPFWQQLSAIADSPVMNKVFDGFYMGVTLAGQALAGLVNNVRWFAGVLGEAYTATKDFINPFVGGLVTIIGLLAIFKTYLLATSAIAFLSKGISTLATMIQLLPTAIALIRSLGLAQALASMSALEMWGAFILPIGLAIGGVYLLMSAFTDFNTALEYLGDLLLGVVTGALAGAISYLILYGSYWIVANGAVLAHTVIMGIYNGLIFVTNTLMGIWRGAISAVTVAQSVLNAVLAMNPIGFVVMLVALAIGAYVAWQGASNGLRKTMTEVFADIAEGVASAINFMIDSINMLIGAINTAKEASNEYFGTSFSLTGEITGKVNEYTWRAKAVEAGNELYDTISNPIEKVKKYFNDSIPSDTMNGGGGYGGGVIPPMEPAGGAGKEPKPVKVKGGKLDKDQQITLAEENLQLITDLARKEVILNYQQLTPQVTITMGDIRETADVDTVIDRLETRLTELYDGSLQGGV